MKARFLSAKGAEYDRQGQADRRPWTELDRELSPEGRDSPKDHLALITDRDLLRATGLARHPSYVALSRACASDALKIQGQRCVCRWLSHSAPLALKSFRGAPAPVTTRSRPTHHHNKAQACVP